MEIFVTCVGVLGLLLIILVIGACIYPLKYHSRQPVKPSAILRAAAERIENRMSLLGCVAISYAAEDLDATDEEKDEASNYFERYKPAYISDADGTWFGPVSDPANQLARILALLLAARDAESEGN